MLIWLPVLDSIQRQPRKMTGTDVWSLRQDIFLLLRQWTSVEAWDTGREVIKPDGEEGQEHNLRKDLASDIWNNSFSQAAEIAQGNKKATPTKINRKPLPLGQGASISCWPGLARPLGFYSELTQVLPETWIVMRAILWGSKPPAHCETADTTISEQKQKQQACCSGFCRAQFPAPPACPLPPKSPGGKRAVLLGEQCFFSLCVGSLIYLFLLPSVFPSTDISSTSIMCYTQFQVLVTQLGTVQRKPLNSQTTKDRTRQTEQELKDTTEQGRKNWGKLHLRSTEQPEKKLQAGGEHGQ